MKTELNTLINNVAKVVATPVLTQTRTGAITCYKVKAIMTDGTELLLRKAMTERPAEIFFFDSYQYSRYDFNDLSNACSATRQSNSVRTIKVESDREEIRTFVKDLISKHSGNFDLIVGVLNQKYKTSEDRMEANNALMTFFPFKDETATSEDETDTSEEQTYPKLKEHFMNKRTWNKQNKRQAEVTAAKRRKEDERIVAMVERKHSTGEWHKCDAIQEGAQISYNNIIDHGLPTPQRKSEY